MGAQGQKWKISGWVLISSTFSFEWSFDLFAKTTVVRVRGLKILQHTLSACRAGRAVVSVAFSLFLLLGSLSSHDGYGRYVVT